MSPVGLPEPEAVLAGTDWAALEHAYGPATDTPAHLAGLLDADQGVRSRALDHLHYKVHHQQTLYTATASAALYVAGILPDPRTDRPVDKERHDFPGSLRTGLLGWLGSVADQVGDEAAEGSRRLGFPPEEYPPFVQASEIRPLLYDAVAAWIADRDQDVRDAAIAACAPLLDDSRLRHRRTALVPLLRVKLAVSTLWQYQERAIEVLAAWGEDTSGMNVQRDAFEVCDAPNNTSSDTGWAWSRSDVEAPPF
ncbi:hypothetical protein GT204_23525 [Streptomyces sp. SID4919]|uniref:hypothetical protein n=1 Tax=unclassified Streptomyces TaxID=2593676 RepID=UPI000823B85F|nr:MULTISPECIES: hypothetical protein [unclassified Streptomyces]MYY11794.1 hypothetical protein [Streptomyces sp. SID4919]SCK11869.1 hypothetical protein YW7DRAFT_00672 [Streptomyces sp. AmelKG-E11A]